MTLPLLFAALAILPADRLAMADRLFNKGDYAAARVEYRALEGAKEIAADELAFRLAECARATGDTAEATRRYSALVAGFPESRHAASAHLQLALAEKGAARLQRLAALDSDRIAPTIRAAALYHLGAERKDVALLRKAVTIDPRGRYALSAEYCEGSILAQDGDPAVRRKGVEKLLGVAFGGSELAEEALYLAASVSYRDGKYGEAGSLYRRSRKMFPKGAHADEIRTLIIWCDYAAGRYADALAACGDGGSDDLLYLKACCLAQTEGGEKARAAFARYLSEYPTGRSRADAELQLARLEFATAVSGKDGTKAVEAARRAVKSGSAADRLRLAWSYEKADRPAEAEAEYAEIVRQAPESDEAARARYARALIAVRAGAWAKAELLLAEFLSCGRLAELQPTALYWRGIAAMQIGHRDEAVRFLSDALARGLGLDESREARLMIAEYDLASGRTQAAKAAYAKLVKEGACARMTASRIHAVGRLLGGEEAVICAKALCEEKSPEWRQAGWAMLGAAEEARGAFSAAIDAYRKALAEPVKTESLAAASLALGKLEMRAGEHAAAEETLKKAVSFNAADPSARGAAYLALAQNAQAKGDRKAAEGYATAVTALFDDPQLVQPAQALLKELAGAAQSGR